MQVYSNAILGLLVLGLITQVLSGMVGPAKGKAGIAAGAMPPADYANALYRLDRTHQNSVESLASFAIAAICAILVGCAPATLALIVWAQVALRLVFSWLYIRGIGIGAGGARTMVFIASSVLTLGLTVWVAVVALGWAG